MNQFRLVMIIKIILLPLQPPKITRRVIYSFLYKLKNNHSYFILPPVVTLTTSNPIFVVLMCSILEISEEMVLQVFFFYHTVSYTCRNAVRVSWFCLKYADIYPPPEIPIIWGLATVVGYSDHISMEFF